MAPHSPLRRPVHHNPRHSSEESLSFGVESQVPLVTTAISIGDRDWQITAVQNQDLLLDTAHELEHFPYGFLLWESAVGLARYLAANPSLVLNKRVLELGAGVGVAGIAAQAMGANVWQTDHQKGALQLASRNARQNGVGGIQQFLADWRSWQHHTRYDVLIGADITYEWGMHFYLERIFRENLAPGGTILLADPGRPQSLEFLAQLEKKDWKIAIESLAVSLPENGKAGKPVDVAILTLSGRKELAYAGPGSSQSTNACKSAKTWSGAGEKPDG